MGGLLSGVGSAVGGKKASKAADAQAQSIRDAAAKAAQTARLGFDYLTTGPGAQAVTPYLTNAGAANTELAGLLGLGNTGAANRAFSTFLASTPYQFQLTQGLNALTGNAATHGMLDSGATLKAVNDYAQDQAKGALGGYFNQLGNLGTMGLDALKTIGAAGSQAGQAGASALMNGANNSAALTMLGAGAQNSGLQGLLGGIGSFLGGGPQQVTGPAQSWGNFFGNIF